MKLQPSWIESHDQTASLDSCTCQVTRTDSRFMSTYLQEPLQVDVVLLFFLTRSRRRRLFQSSGRHQVTDDAEPTCSQRFWNISFSFCVINFHRLLQRTIRSVLGTSFMFTISSAQYRE